MVRSRGSGVQRFRGSKVQGFKRFRVQGVQEVRGFKGFKGFTVREPPDIALLVPHWRTRALVRAELIEGGFEVVAADSWLAMKTHLAPGAQPRLAVVDLKDLPDPMSVLRHLQVLMRPSRVLVIAGIATVERAQIDALGFRAIARPFAVKDLVGAARAIVTRAE